MIQLNPNYNAAYHNKGIALYNLSKKEEAIECYNKAIELDPDYARVYYDKGDVLYDLDKYIEAIECYNQAIKFDPNDATAYYNKGNALSALGEKQKAIQCYDQAIKLKPDYTYAYYNKGIVLYYLEKNLEAIECFNKVIHLNFKHSKAYYYKGLALYYLDKNLEAIECYDQAIKLDPNDATAYNNKGITLNDLDNKEEAIQCYDQAIQLNSNYADAYFNKGNALRDLGRKKEAIECFNKVIELNPKDANAYNNKGNVLYGLYRQNDAIECYNKAIMLDPEDALYYCNKGRALNVIHKEQEALACFNKAFEISKNGKLGNKFSKSNIVYINNVLSKDRKELIKKLTSLQQMSDELDKTIERLDINNPFSKTIIEQFNLLKLHKTGLTSVAINSLGDSKEINKEVTQSLYKQIEDIQAQMQTISLEIKNSSSMIMESHKAIKLGINTGFSEIKEEQKKHTEAIKKQSLQLEKFNETTERLKEKIKSDNKARQQDKQKMQEQISSITDKIQKLALQSDIETITQEMTNIMNEAKITKGRLGDIEDDIDRILEQQDKYEISKTNVNVHCLTQIIYDNALLNNLELLKSASQYFGIGKALDLSQLLSPELIDKAIETKDNDLILAGMLSLS